MLTIEELEALRGLVQINVNVNLPKGHHPMAYDQVRLPFILEPKTITMNALVEGTKFQLELPTGTTKLTFDSVKKLSGFTLNTTSATLTTVDARGLEEVIGYGVQISGHPLLASVDLSDLTTNDADVEISGNDTLSSVDITSLVQLGGNLYLSANALPAAGVNAALARLVLCTSDGATPWAGTGDFSGDNMEDPTGQGLLDKATLVGRGATIYDHSNPAP